MIKENGFWLLKNQQGIKRFEGWDASCLLKGCNQCRRDRRFESSDERCLPKIWKKKLEWVNYLSTSTYTTENRVNMNAERSKDGTVLKYSQPSYYELPYLSQHQRTYFVHHRSEYHARIIILQLLYTYKGVYLLLL